MRLTEAEFWRMTPRRMLAMAKQWYEERRWWSSRFAGARLIGREGQGGRVIQPKDVFPELEEE